MSQKNRNRQFQPSEHAEQAALLQWWRLQAKEQLKPLLFAIPNGGARNKITGVRLKAEGVVSGVPDLFLAYPSNGSGGLFIELKRQIGAKLSTAQKNMLKNLSEAGYQAVVCYGWQEAKKIICDYLGW